jgi:hypothetical protein
MTMGQAFYIANLDKRECIHPHDMGDGYKLLELNYSLNALAMLLANSKDHPWADAPMLGRWAGDRIVVMGEYEAADDFEETFTSLDVAALHKYLDRVL